jgi:hypothetical protein
MNSCTRPKQTDSKNDVARISWARPTSFILQEHCRSYRQRLAPPECARLPNLHSRCSQCCLTFFELGVQTNMAKPIVCNLFVNNPTFLVNNFRGSQHKYRFTQIPTFLRYRHVGIGIFGLKNVGRYSVISVFSVFVGTHH